MKPAAEKIPGAVIAGLVLAVVLDTGTHIAWKLAVARIPPEASFVAITRGACASPFFWGAMIAYVGLFYNWMRVLEHADLSFAQPITALGYVAVLAISGHLLHENISAMKITGVALIFVGVYFISRTPFRTAQIDPEEAPDPAADIP